MSKIVKTGHVKSFVDDTLFVFCGQSILTHVEDLDGIDCNSNFCQRSERCCIESACSACSLASILPHSEGFDGHVVNISEEFSIKYVGEDQLYHF